MVNITGVDNTNHTMVSPHYQDIRLEYGKTYTTNDMISLVQGVIDPSAESFKVISLSNPKPLQIKGLAQTILRHQLKNNIIKKTKRTP